MNYYNPYNPYDPYGFSYPGLPKTTFPLGSSTTTQPQQGRVSGKIDKVHGLEGAKNFAKLLAPDSQVIVMDDTDNLQYLITTDSGGTPNITAWRLQGPVNLEKKEAENSITLDDVMKRLDRIESRLGGAKNVKSNSGHAEQN